LHLLSFDALVNDQREYLVQRHVITYVPSGTVLHLLRTLPKQSVDYIPFLGVGDVFYGEGNSVVVQRTHLTRGASQFAGLLDLEGDHLKPLASARREVVTLARIVGPGSKTLLGNHATESEVKAQPLSRFRILHFAAHGVADTVFPRRSSIVLGSSPYSSDDGLLQSWEISSFHLNADLVTLSACETKIGRLQGQEGISNLVRAFLFAGARSVVASSWATEDMFTLALMEQFYRHLVNGTDKGAALRQAKLDLMERFGADALPFHWASFSIVGDASSAIDLVR
jgi:CHAT domain-containing protein